SRRRHTRSDRDWSSDVCSSDLFDTVIGVIDHNTFVQDRNQTAIYIYDSNWDGRSYGDGSWVASTGFGSSQFLFIEDNNFTHTSRSEERRVGKECRSQVAMDHYK